MDPIALKLLEKERVCVLAVTLDDGSPHVAEVHYSLQTKPVKIFIQTYPTVKVQAIQKKGGSTKAAVVAGLSEKDFTSLQMRGDVKIISNPTELEVIYKVHYSKLPEAEKHKDKDTIFLEFVPTWWRYSDFNTDPETVISSV